MSFDEALLDEPARLERRDEQRLLWSLATAGAQARRALETSADFGVDTWRGGGLPRALLVATDGRPAGVAELVTGLAGARTPALSWPGAELPRWAGPDDVLLVASLDGRHARLAGLVAQAVARGMLVAAVAPAAGPVAFAAGGRTPLYELARELHPRAARWSVLTPLLLALDALGVAVVPPEVVVEIADTLDQQAEINRPHGDAFTNPAKALAIEFADAVPVIAGAGAIAAIAARVIAQSVQEWAGVPAVSAGLPDEAMRTVALLRGAGAASGNEDFFRDRVDEEPARRARLLVAGPDAAPDEPAGQAPGSPPALEHAATRRAVEAVEEAARRAGARSSTIDVSSDQPLACFAAATAFGDFTAAYLALGLGLDPGADRPGEREL